MNNILVSLATSLIVSNITFILGLKAGKNQSDRKELKNKYQNIYIHLKNIEEVIGTVKPKKWSDYEEIKKGNRSISAPLLRRMNIEGDNLDLNKKLFKKCEELEKECLKYSYKYYNYFYTMYDICLEVMKSNYEDIYEGNYEICASKEESVNGIIVYELSLGIFLFDDDFNKHISKIKKEEENYYISFRLKDKYRKRLNVYRNSSNVSPIEFLEKCKLKIKSTNEINIMELDNERNELIRNLEKIKEKVVKRAKEPYTFWETLLGAFIDIFKF
ncbi:TPA: hypothetical protein PTV74_003263 [Clostridium botulinum]|nr:hypothetical protein [Clostridium botulinum]HDK7206417.1 hypothetical protein [Clostridium botulinum]HDK7210153.1 hypothetical protein [Clostridium botulinum]HDK7265602.1 hypothetical protein [Clostridium botulinum]HDK7269450.1 hypothetical protein [Clostridium botulinum]